MTYTFAILEVSPETYAEIRNALLAAEYEQSFTKDTDGREVIDMHGVALKERP